MPGEFGFTLCVSPFASTSTGCGDGGKSPHPCAGKRYGCRGAAAAGRCWSGAAGWPSASNKPKATRWNGCAGSRRENPWTGGKVMVLVRRRTPPVGVTNNSEKPVASGSSRGNMGATVKLRWPRLSDGTGERDAEFLHTLRTMNAHIKLKCDKCSRMRPLTQTLCKCGASSSSLVGGKIKMWWEALGFSQAPPIGALGDGITEFRRPIPQVWVRLKRRG